MKTVTLQSSVNRTADNFTQNNEHVTLQCIGIVIRCTETTDYGKTTT